MKRFDSVLFDENHRVPTLPYAVDVNGRSSTMPISCGSRERWSFPHSRTGGVRVDVPDVLPSPVELRYRDRVDYAFGAAPDGTTYPGLHRADEAGVFPVEDCQLQSVEANETRRRIGRVLGATRLRPYDESRRTGVLRGLVVRESGNETMVTLVVSSAKHLSVDSLREAATERM